MYSKIFKAKVRKILRQIILRKYVVKFSLTFGNNLRITGLENFENIPKFCGNFRKILKQSILWKLYVTGAEEREGETRFTLGLNAAKNTDYIKKFFK